MLAMAPALACASGSQRQLQATLCQRTDGRCVHTQHGQQKYSTGSFATWYTATMTAPSTAYMTGVPSSTTAEAMRRALVPWTNGHLFVLFCEALVAAWRKQAKQQAAAAADLSVGCGAQSVDVQKLSFTPTSLAVGSGYIAAGGQCSQAR